MATGGFDGCGPALGARRPDLLPSAVSSTPASPAGWPSRLTADRLPAAGSSGALRWDVRAGSAFAQTVTNEATAFAGAPDGTRYAQRGGGLENRAV